MSVIFYPLMLFIHITNELNHEIFTLYQLV